MMAGGRIVWQRRRVGKRVGRASPGVTARELLRPGSMDSRLQIFCFSMSHQYTVWENANSGDLQKYNCHKLLYRSILSVGPALWAFLISRRILELYSSSGEHMCSMLRPSSCLYQD